MVLVAGCLQWVLMARELISFCLFPSPSEEVKPRSVLALSGSTARRLEGPWKQAGKGLERRLESETGRSTSMLGLSLGLEN